MAAEVHEENRHELAACFDDGSLHKKTFQYEELMEIQLIQVKYQSLSVRLLLPFSCPENVRAIANRGCRPQAVGRAE